MAIKKQPEVLVIDDAPSVALSVRNAVPAWKVYEAYDGVSGMALVRAHRSSLDLVVLDVRMPHDGVMVCVQIRTEAPQLRILPFTGAAESVAVLSGLGCAPALLKPAPPELLTTALHQAIGLAPPPLPADALFPYVQQLAAQSEHALALRAHRMLRVVVLAASDMLRTGLREAISMAGGSVRLESTSAAVLRNGLAHLRVCVLVADAGMQVEAAELAEQFGLPLLIVALTMTAAYRAIEVAQGIVVDPVAPGTMAEALAAVAAGKGYRDAVLDELFTTTSLNETERAIGLLLLQGWQTDAIADKLKRQAQTVYYYRSRIYSKLGVTDLEGLRAWADSRRHVSMRQASG